MRLNPFANCRVARREAWSLSAGVILRDAKLADRDRQLADVRGELAEAAEARDYFKDQYEAAHRRAERVTGANQRLGTALGEERAKVTALEKIAGPYVEARTAPTPAYDEVTSEHPLPTWPDSETTTELRFAGATVKSLADAFGGAA